MLVLELRQRSQHDFRDLLSIIDIFWRRLPSALMNLIFIYSASTYSCSYILKSCFSNRPQYQWLKTHEGRR